MKGKTHRHATRDPIDSRSIKMKFCYVWLILLNRTYETRRVIISSRFRIAKRLENGVWLNNLIFESHRFLWWGKEMRWTCTRWSVFRGGFVSMFVCVCSGCRSCQSVEDQCVMLLRLPLNRNLRIETSYYFESSLRYHTPQVPDLWINLRLSACLPALPTY